MKTQCAKPGNNYSSDPSKYLSFDLFYTLFQIKMSDTFVSWLIADLLTDAGKNLPIETT